MQNDQEWRQHILRKLEKLEQNQTELLVVATTLKVKIGLFSAVFGSVFGAFSGLIIKKLGL